MGKLVYAVWLKASPKSGWHFSGVVESDKEVANRVWTEIVRDLGYYDYELRYATYGVCIDRSRE